jgi:hypothetical protein
MNKGLNVIDDVASAHDMMLLGSTRMGSNNAMDDVAGMT